MTDYRRAFKIACELLNGDVLYGIDADTIFKIMMNKDGMTSNSSYEEYILSHLQDLDHGQYAIKALEQEPFINKPCVSSRVCEHDKNKVLDKAIAEIDEHIEYNEKMNYMGIVGGLLLAKNVLEKYKAESEDKE